MKIKRYIRMNPEERRLALFALTQFRNSAIQRGIDPIISKTNNLLGYSSNRFADFLHFKGAKDPIVQGCFSFIKQKKRLDCG